MKAVAAFARKNRGHFYFLNNSVKHWTTLIIFGMQHYEETQQN